MDINAHIEESLKINKDLSVLNSVKIHQSNAPAAYAFSASIRISHTHNAIFNLLKLRLHGEALALLRVAFECLQKSLWVYAKGNKKDSINHLEQLSVLDQEDRYDLACIPHKILDADKKLSEEDIPIHYPDLDQLRSSLGLPQKKLGTLKLVEICKFNGTLSDYHQINKITSLSIHSEIRYLTGIMKKDNNGYIFYPGLNSEEFLIHTCLCSEGITKFTLNGLWVLNEILDEPIQKHIPEIILIKESLEKLLHESRKIINKHNT